MLSMFYFLTLYMQNVLGYSPIAAGAAYLPLTFAVGISRRRRLQAAPQDRQPGGDLRRRAHRGGRPAPAQPVPVDGGYVAHILPGLLLVAFGIGPVFVGVTTAANAGVGPSRAGLAAAILNSSQQLGGALGLAIFSAVGSRAHPAPPRRRHARPGRHHLRPAARPGRPAPRSPRPRRSSPWRPRTPAKTRRPPRGLEPTGRTLLVSNPPWRSGEERTTPARVLVVGRSPSVLVATVELLRGKGHRADATNQFDQVLDDYDVSDLDVLVFGGMVPRRHQAVPPRRDHRAQPRGHLRPGTRRHPRRHRRPGRRGHLRCPLGRRRDRVPPRRPDRPGDAS